MCSICAIQFAVRMPLHRECAYSTLQKPTLNENTSLNYGNSHHKITIYKGKVNSNLDFNCEVNHNKKQQLCLWMWFAFD